MPSGSKPNPQHGDFIKDSTGDRGPGETGSISSHTRSYTILYLPVSVFLLPFTLIDCFHPVITSWSHHFHPLAAIVALLTLLFSPEFSVLSSFIHISPSHLRLFFIPLLCFARPPPSPPLLPPASPCALIILIPSALPLNPHLLLPFFSWPFPPRFLGSQLLSLPLCSRCCCKGQVSSMNKL